MQLVDYLAEKEISPADFARQVGRDRSTVGRWVRGLTRPDDEALKTISGLTGGKVTPNDFFAIGDTLESDAASAATEPRLDPINNAEQPAAESAGEASCPKEAAE